MSRGEVQVLSQSVTVHYGEAEESIEACRRGIGRWIKDPFCGLSHAFGAMLSVAGLIVLLAIAWGTTREIIAVSVYGTSMILLYTASALAHSIHCSPKTALRLDQFDYAAIFVLIGGTYTPICLGPLWGPWGWTLLSVIWGLAIVGILTVLFLKDQGGWIRMALYIVMGWLVFLATGPLSNALPATAWAWLIGGGTFYTVGAIVFAAQKPDLWPGRFNYHDLWHVLALSGSACHFFLVVTMVS
jgi:hemolysin III